MANLTTDPEAAAPVNQELFNNPDDGNQLDHLTQSANASHPTREDDPFLPLEGVQALDPGVLGQDASATGNPRQESPTSGHPPPPGDTQHKRIEWLALALRKWSLAAILFVEVSLIAVIVVLEIISVKRSGIVSVHQPEPVSPRQSALKKLWTQALLWTTLPNFVFQVFKSTWDGVSNALLVREPYVELTEGALAERSIELDYRTWNSFWAWAHAFKNDHFVAGSCSFLGLILSLVVIPLTAHLFDTAPVVVNATAPARYASFFNETAFANGTDLRSVFDLVSAIRVYGGQPLPWTDEQYAYQNFSLAAGWKAHRAVNVTVNTTAYSAYLLCETMKSADYHFSASSQGSGDVRVDVQFTDRGCDVSKPGVLVVSGDRELYVNTWPKEDCSTEAGYSRFCLTAARRSFAPGGSLSNVITISCIPNYWLTPGELTVMTSDFSVDPVVGSFTVSDNSTRNDPGYAFNSFETALHQYVTSSPATPSYETDIGRLIYTYSARYLSPAEPLDASALSNATSTIFTSVYSVFANSVLFQHLTGDQFTDINGKTISATTTAIVSSTQTRLFVVSPIAYTIVAILVVIMACTICAAVHTYKRPSVLHEEPKGLLSYAAMLRHSRVNDLVEYIILHGQEKPPKQPWWKRCCRRMTCLNDIERDGEEQDSPSSPQPQNAIATGNGSATLTPGNHGHAAMGSTSHYRGRPIKTVKDEGWLKNQSLWAGEWRMEGKSPIEEAIVFTRSTESSQTKEKRGKWFRLVRF